jgi:hypothetical protein
MADPTTMHEALTVYRQMTADGVTAPEAALALCAQYPAIAEPWQMCTNVYRLAGAPYGNDPDGMVRWFSERRG